MLTSFWVISRVWTLGSRTQVSVTVANGVSGGSSRLSSSEIIYALLLGFIGVC